MILTFVLAWFLLGGITGIIYTTMVTAEPDAFGLAIGFFSGGVFMFMLPFILLYLLISKL